MQAPPIPVDDDLRLDALAEYGLEPDRSQDEVGTILELAASLFKVPTVLLSIVERHRQIFPARVGLDVCETSRDVSFCAHALEREDILFVPDATLDLRFHDNPLVTGVPYIRFYAGIPLKAASGHILGTLCLIDSRPHGVFTPTDRKNLTHFASLVLDKLELRRLERMEQEAQNRFKQIAARSPDGIVCADQDGKITFWNEAASRLFGYSLAEAQGQSIDIIVPERMRGSHSGGLQRVAQGGPARLLGKTIELPAQRKDGSEFSIELSLSAWTEDGQKAFGSIIRDISDRRANESRLFRLAHLDPLTELPNRMVLRNRLDEITKGAFAACVMILDLDGFKEINDTLGHSAGDLLLREVAERLLTCVSPTDTVARLGGDEFALLLPENGDPIQSAEVADRVILALAEAFIVEGEEVNVSASIGLALFPAHGTEAGTLLAAADLALYKAKAEGRQCRRFFSPDLRLAAISKRAQEIELRRAVEQDEFTLFYQPQVSARDGSLVGAEALIRWWHPERGLIQPATFLPSLESGKLAVPVGNWVIRAGCQQAAEWRRQGAPDFRMSVNLFGVQFLNGDLAETVRAALAEFSLPGSALELEITENIILRHDEAMIRPLRELRQMGVGIAFDDFGTGYGSLSFLKRYPLTRLKVDKSFVQNICTSDEDAALVRATILLGKSFNLGVIAEGVETAEQAAMLAAEGCTELQGYFYGRPVTSKEFERLFWLGAGKQSAMMAS